MTVQMISRYRIVEQLGSGGMGTVYLAEDTRLGRRVALKLLSGDVAGNPRSLLRFQREARAASSLNHPNICTIYEIDEHQGRHFIAMEYMEGRTLSAFVGGQPLAAGRVIDIALQIAGALEAAHAKGIVHRDIKPANVFVKRNGQVKVLDFGLAKVLQAPPPPEGVSGGPQTWSHETREEADLSAPHSPLGTVPYMSPEQARGEELDARSDLFSFGLVLYEMTTGVRAFRGGSPAVIFYELLSQAPKAPIHLNPDLPPRLSEIIVRLLEKDRDLRYQTASDLRADLKRLKRDLDPLQGASSNSLSAGLPPAGLGSDADSSVSPAVPGAREGLGPLARKLRNAVNSLPRPRTAAFAAAAVILLALAGVFLLRPARYYPYIVFGEFEGDSESLRAGLVGFALKRALSQFPDVSVVDQQEFSHILAVEKERREAAAAAPGESTLLRRLSGLWRREAEQPALTVSGRIQDSLGMLEMQVDLVNRGRGASFTSRFRGVDDLITNGIDEWVLNILGLYDAQIDRNAARRRPAYRPAVQLLSRYWDALRHYWHGAQAWKRLEMSMAERELRSALEIDPTFALAHLMLGEVRIFQNQWDAAQMEIVAARSQASALTEIDQLRVEAFLARVSGKPFEERVQLQKLIGLQPHRKEYAYELAESYFHTADVEDAIGKYLDALRLDEGYALAHNHIGYCYAWKGDHPRALDSMKRYLEIDGSPNAYDSLGDAYMSAGFYGKAAEMKAISVEQDPSLYYASRSLAYIEILTGRHDAAEERLLSLLNGTEDNTQKARFYASLAFLHYRERNFERASQMCALGLEQMGPGQADAPGEELLWLSGLIELGRGRLPDARRVSARLRAVLDANSISAMNYKPAYKYWLHLQSRILAQEGRNQEAAAALNDLKWVKHKLGYWSTPFDLAFFMDEIGQIYERLNRPADAEQAYREALAYNPHYALARFHMARLLGTGQRASEARREAEAFLAEWKDADPDVAEHAAARQMLEGHSGN